MKVCAVCKEPLVLALNGKVELVHKHSGKAFNCDHGEGPFQCRDEKCYIVHKVQPIAAPDGFHDVSDLEASN